MRASSFARQSAVCRRPYCAAFTTRRRRRDTSSAWDADLQHPPEKVPELLKALIGGAPFVLGTRYAVGTVVDKDWPLHRRIISSGARLLARPLTPLSDPMSGFFGMDAALFRRTEPTVNPVGFKIALELFVKSRCTSSVEVQHAATNMTNKRCFRICADVCANIRSCERNIRHHVNDVDVRSALRPMIDLCVHTYCLSRSALILVFELPVRAS
jgi:hypothetical protein